jgi:hypothetical protein
MLYDDWKTNGEHMTERKRLIICIHRDGALIHDEKDQLKERKNICLVYGAMRLYQDFATGASLTRSFHRGVDLWPIKLSKTMELSEICIQWP